MEGEKVTKKVKPHSHYWSQWMPWDKKHIYRYCMVFQCPEIEKMVAKA